MHCEHPQNEIDMMALRELVLFDAGILIKSESDLRPAQPAQPFFVLVMYQALEAILRKFKIVFYKLTACGK